VSSFIVYPVYIEDLVSVVSCSPKDRVYIIVARVEHPFTFVYEYLLKDLNVQFPLTDFKCELLNATTVVLSHLHPNSCAFINAC